MSEVIEAAVDAMRRHGGSENVQEFGCGAFGVMCYDDAENRRLAGRHGAIEAVVDLPKTTEKTRISGLRVLGAYEHDASRRKRECPEERVWQFRGFVALVAGFVALVA